VDQVWVRALVPVSTKENGKDRKISPGECFLMDRAEAVKEAQTRNPAVVLMGFGANEKPVSNEEVIKQLEDGIRLRDSQIQQLTDLVTEGKKANLEAENKIQELTAIIKDQTTQIDLLKQAGKAKKAETDKKDQ
jgi:predicted Zn-dependent protease